jgi:hypothetical protein
LLADATICADFATNADASAAADDLSTTATDLAIEDASLTTSDLAGADLAGANSAGPDASVCVAAFLAGLPAWYDAHAFATVCIPRTAIFNVLGQVLACCDSPCGPGDAGPAGCIATLTYHDAALGDAGAFSTLIDVSIRGTNTASGLNSVTCVFTGSGPNSSWSAHLEVDDDGGTARVSPTPGPFSSTTQYSGCVALGSWESACVDYDEAYLSVLVPNLSAVTLRSDSAPCP